MSRPGPQPAVGPEDHPLAQVVDRQHLVRLGKPHLPRQPGELDRGLRRRPGAAVVPRDQDHVGLRLRHPRRDRPHPRLRDQLHADARPRVDLLQVVDQLRQVLDRVDVVVRRRRDQAHPRRRMPQLRDQLGHLDPRQLPALAGLRALSDLDLQLLAVVQVVGRHPEPPARHLLDLGARVVPVRLRLIVRRVLAPLARVRLRPDPVHRHVQRLVRLRAERPEAHPRRHEPLADRGDRTRPGRSAPAPPSAGSPGGRAGGSAAAPASPSNTASRPRTTRGRRPTAGCASPAPPRRGSRPSAAPCRSRRSAAPRRRRASRAHASPRPAAAPR